MNGTGLTTMRLPVFGTHLEASISSPGRWLFVPGKTLFGSDAVSGKMLLIRIVENYKIDVYFKAG